MKVRDVLFLLALAATEGPCAAMHRPRELYSRDIIAPSDIQPAYDFIVAGGGLAGMVIASRLSEDSSVTVLVLEAGLSGDAVANSVNPPAGAYYSSIVGTDYDWQHVTTPQANLNNRVISWPRGKILGGSSAMNAMYLVRPSTEEMDAWNEINGVASDSTSGGNWGWDSMYSYMKQSENFTAPNAALLSYLPIAYDASSYGSGGPMQVSYPELMINIVGNWTSSLEAAGIPLSTNPNSGSTLGGFITASSINPANWTRSYSRSAYIDPILPRSNLHILPNSTVVRIVLSDDTDASGKVYAKGIEFAQDPKSPRVTVGVRKEVVLAGGALGSPNILMHSGVGPKDVLENASVPLKIELPGVGQHLQDHLTAGVVWNSPVETAGDIHNSGSDFSNSPEFLSMINDAVAFVNSTALFSTQAPVFQQQILDSLNDSASTLVPSQYPEVAEGYKAIYNTMATKFFPDIAQIEMLMSIISPGQVSIQSALQHPYSTGRVYINSTNPFDPITIDPQYYSHFADIVIMRQGIKLVRNVGAAFGAGLGAEISPGPGIQTDDDIDAWLVNGAANTQYHPIASCTMLPQNQGGVVDTNLLVHGLANVRVADASVFPFEFAAHLGSATYAVAEQASVLIKNASYNSPTVSPFSETTDNPDDSNSPGSAALPRLGSYPSHMLLVMCGIALHWALQYLL